MLGGASNAGGMWADWVDRVVRPWRPCPEGTCPEGPGDVPIWWPWARGERVPWHDRALRWAWPGPTSPMGPKRYGEVPTKRQALSPAT